MRAIRALVGEIQQLAEAGPPPREFYPEFLRRVVSGLAAVGGAVWVAGNDGQRRAEYLHEFDQALLDVETGDGHQNLELIENVFANGEPRLEQPRPSDGDEAEAPTAASHLQLFAPVKSNGQVEAVVQILQRPRQDPAIQKGYLQFLITVCRFAALWLKKQEEKKQQDQVAQMRRQEQFAHHVYDSLDVGLTASNIANEARRVIECDRVSVAVCKGRNCTVKAISGQDTFDNRSNVVDLLRKLATRVVAGGEPLWHCGDPQDLPPQIEDALEDYVEESFAKTIVVLPLRKPEAHQAARQDEADAETDAAARIEGEIIGALVIEQIEHAVPRAELEPRVRVVAEHSARALNNAVEHNNLFLMPVWRTMGRAMGLFRGRALTKTTIVLSIVVALLAVLIFVPYRFGLDAGGVLQPAERQDVFAKVKGVVTDVHVDSGDMVTAGQTLIELRNPELEARWLAKTKERDTVEHELRTIVNRRVRTRDLSRTERIELNSEQSRLSLRLKALDDELAVLGEQRSHLRIRSPMSGRIISWNLKKLLKDRPVTEGDKLLTVANPDGPWELELHMPEKRMGHLDKARRELADGEKLRVSYILVSEPGNTRYGWVEEIQPAADLHDTEGLSVPIRVSINFNDPDNPIRDPRSGTEVTGNVECGYGSVGSVWFYEVYEAIQRAWYYYF